MAMGFVFLLFLLIALIEMAQVFSAYIALVNSAREGAVFASLYPDLTNATAYPESSELYQEYLDRVKAEAIAAGLDTDFLVISRPVAPQLDANCPITSTVTFQLSTFTSSMTLPFFGRMGLPSTYLIIYSMQMPIRYADELGC